MYPQLRGLAEGPAALRVLASVPPTVRRLTAPAGERVRSPTNTTQQIDGQLTGGMVSPEKKNEMTGKDDQSGPLGLLSSTHRKHECMW
jgi:hypothetical protein